MNFSLKVYPYEHTRSDERFPEYKVNITEIEKPEIGAAGISFNLKRYSYPFFSKYYVPCFLLIILTSISFFIPPKLVPGRGGMLVTLFLVLNNIFSNSKVNKQGHSCYTIGYS